MWFIAAVLSSQFVAPKKPKPLTNLKQRNNCEVSVKLKLIFSVSEFLCYKFFLSYCIMYARVTKRVPKRWENEIYDSVIFRHICVHRSSCSDQWGEFRATFNSPVLLVQLPRDNKNAETIRNVNNLSPTASKMLNTHRSKLGFMTACCSTSSYLLQNQWICAGCFWPGKVHGLLSTAAHMSQTVDIKPSKLEVALKLQFCS